MYTAPSWRPADDSKSEIGEAQEMVITELGEEMLCVGYTGTKVGFIARVFNKDFEQYFFQEDYPDGSRGRIGSTYWSLSYWKRSRVPLTPEEREALVMLGGKKLELQTSLDAIVAFLEMEGSDRGPGGIFDVYPVKGMPQARNAYKNSPPSLGHVEKFTRR